MHKYRLISKKGEGTFSEVLKAQSIKTGRYVAIKCMKNTFDNLDQVNNLREIQALRRLSPHQHIITLHEVLYDQPTGRLALVFELMDMNMYESIRGRRHYMPEKKVCSYMYQLLKAMDHMHRNGIFHRDIKPENILIADDTLKLADFGSCRGIYSKQPYTEYISTRWYRAPECLLTDGFYSYKMDMWGVGCVFFEVLSLYPLFPGTNELDQINKIHNVLGFTCDATTAAMANKDNDGFLPYLADITDHEMGMGKNLNATAISKDEKSGLFDPCPKTGKMLEKKPQSGGFFENALQHLKGEDHYSKENVVNLIQKLLIYVPQKRISARQALRHPAFKSLRDEEKAAKNSFKANETSTPEKLASENPSQSTRNNIPKQETNQQIGGGKLHSNQNSKDERELEQLLNKFEKEVDKEEGGSMKSKGGTGIGHGNNSYNHHNDSVMHSKAKKNHHNQFNSTGYGHNQMYSARSKAESQDDTVMSVSGLSNKYSHHKPVKSGLANSHLSATMGPNYGGSGNYVGAKLPQIKHQNNNGLSATKYLQGGTQRSNRSKLAGSKKFGQNASYGYKGKPKNTYGVY